MERAPSKKILLSIAGLVSYLVGAAIVGAIGGNAINALSQPAPIFPYTQDPNTGIVTWIVAQVFKSFTLAGGGGLSNDGSNNLDLTALTGKNVVISATGGTGVATVTPTTVTLASAGASVAVGAASTTVLPATSTPAVISGGTVFSITSGCGTTGTVTGGSTIGTFAAGAVTTCAPVFVLPTAPHGWNCFAQDLTHPADAFTQSATSASGCTVNATITSGDTIQLTAFGY